MNKKIVMLPALMCDDSLYSHQIKILSKFCDIKVFTFKDVDNTLDASSIILEELGDKKFHVIGTSMGGYIAMELMRNTKNIESLCLVNTNYYEDSIEKKAQRFAQIEEAQTLIDSKFRAINNDIANNYLHNVSYQKVYLLKEMANNIGRLGFINQQKLILSRKSSVEDFQYYDIPTLVVSGHQDVITTPELHLEMVNNLKKGTLVTIDNCGHLSPIDQPEALSALLECWIKNV